jgi:chromosome segregation protein
VHLKSLTLRGFKSFASTTTLELEPGITCVVGPNGSGKSNVVDALSWVMGEQGAKSLRGGRMEDVIFAGTAGRPPLGRAEVSLTIDNADGALPIEYSEVTISRTMFRNGGSEYAINGRTCRLLDVSELLSDSGIGREMHVIVGQGRLDSVLHATAEERRGLIEEAAGVLKHRKRKEKALRKLEATEGNLTRLADLLAEIRRQLKPLGRQAEVARKAAVVQADVRDARARLLADELVTVRAALEAELADETVLRRRQAEVEAAIAAARDEEGAVEAALREDLPAMAAAQETWFALAGMRERLQGTARLAAERVRNAAEAPAVPTGTDPDALLDDARRLRAKEARTATEAQTLREALDLALDTRREAERAHAEEDQRVAGLHRAAADRREGLARLQGQVDTVRSRAAAAQEELDRLARGREEALARALRAERDFTALETRIAGLDAGEVGLDAEHEAAAAHLAGLDDRLAKLRAEVQAADQERAALAARLEALRLGLDRRDGAGALLAASEPVSGLLGSVAALMAVRPGYETALSAALGEVADALVAEHPGVAMEALARLRAEDLGRAGLLVGDVGDTRPDTGVGLEARSHRTSTSVTPSPDRGDSPAGTAWPALPPDATYAVDAVTVSEPLRPALARVLFKVAVVGDLDAARRLVGLLPDVTAVTRDGDLWRRHYVAGGSASAPSLLEVQAAVEEAGEQLDAAAHARERLAFDLARLEEEREQARHRVDVALSRLHESDAHLAAVAEELAQHGSAARAARGEAERLARAIQDAEEAGAGHLRGLAELEQRLEEARTGPDDEPDAAQRERLAEAARAARASETDARLALRTAEERARALAGRAEGLERTAAQEKDARARAVAHRERVRREGLAAQAVAFAVRHVLERLEASVEAAAEERAALDESRRGREERLLACRASLRELACEHEELVGTVHRDEMARAQQRMRIEQLEERAADELGLDPQTLVADYGPHQPVPVLTAPPHGAGREAEVPRDSGPAESAPTSGTVAATVPYVREEQQKRLRAAERALAVLGKVNPLALEEFSAMEERHRFLTEQLEDLRRTRRDLLDIVREVDERVEEVFTEAWHDVRDAFERVFRRLFPGGEGRLVLTDPDDMLATGVEVEARPPGKKVKRLSLLSGGERSLVAVAFLVSLFQARPSPFYILDEVEAALDDTNLGRLLEIYQELRATSQLVVVTHQKRTMEIGDALYGVTMRGDGVSAVISQRLRAERSEDAIAAR